MLCVSDSGKEGIVVAGESGCDCPFTSMRQYMKGLLGWLWSNTEFSFVSDPRDITKDLLLRNEVQDSWYYLDTHRQLAGLLAVHI